MTRETGRLTSAATILAAALAIAAADASPPARAGHARVDLLADSTAVPPRGTATLGVRFALDEGWHIYWRNPGESGGAPAVKWNAPADVTIGALQWPAPERFAAPGDTTYGYRRGAILLATIARTPAAGTGPIVLRPTVEYQICKDVCVKETARPSLTLAAGPAAPASSAAEIAAARALLPEPMPPAWNAAFTAAPGELTLTIVTGRRESDGSFLPYPSDLIDDSAPQRVEPRPDGLVLHIRKAPGAKAPGLHSEGATTLDGLLIRPRARAVEIHARLK